MVSDPPDPCKDKRHEYRRGFAHGQQPVSGAIRAAVSGLSPYNQSDRLSRPRVSVVPPSSTCDFSIAHYRCILRTAASMAGSSVSERRRLMVRLLARLSFGTIAVVFVACTVAENRPAPATVETATRPATATPATTSTSSPTLPPVTVIPTPAPTYLPAVEAAEEIVGPGFAVRTLAGGALQIRIGSDLYVINSSYSYPGEVIGNHFLAAEAEAVQAGLTKRVVSENELEVSLSAGYYRLQRIVEITGSKIVVHEAIRNESSDPVGLIIEHKLKPPGNYDLVQAGGEASALDIRGMPDNPSLFVRGNESNLGILVQDNVFRLQLEGFSGPSVAKFGTRHFGLDGGASYTFEWVIYPLIGSQDYYSYINWVRNDLDVNFTIDGPFDFFDAIRNADLLRDPERLRIYLQRNQLKIVALTPWLDYDNFNFTTQSRMSRREYAEIMSSAAAAIKSIDPSVKVLGSMQSNLVLLPTETVEELYAVLPEERKKQGIYEASATETAILARSGLPLMDSLTVSAQGGLVFELYYPYFLPVFAARRDTPPQVAIAVHAAPGNSLLDHWSEQAVFITESVGLDGVYIDQFSSVVSAPLRYSYDQWDGHTVDINPESGQITKQYTDAALVSGQSQVNFLQALRARGKTVVANTLPATKELQSIRVLRFFEAGGGGFNPLTFTRGTQPTFYHSFTRGHLLTPIGLGYWAPSNLGQTGTENYARVIMKAAITYLRHGLIYYHFFTEIPESGPGSGDYGLFNNMFPITPRFLGAGFVIGEERIITAISGTFLWQRPEQPLIMAFDAEGRLKSARATLVRTSAGWDVAVEVDDWEEVVVVYSPD